MTISGVVRTEEALDVLDALVARRVQDCFDVAGRPLGEGRSVAFTEVATEFQTCPYSGVRCKHEKLMNLSALRAMPSYAGVTTLLAFIAARRRRMSGRRIATALDMAYVTGAGVFLADYLALRAEERVPSGEIPRSVAALFKVCLGFQLAYFGALYGPDDAMPSLPDADGFLAYLDDNALLVGEREVCAGPAAMIRQAYEAIVGERTPGEDKLPADCAALAIDWPAFDRFAEAGCDLWGELTRFALLAPGLRPRLDPADPAAAALNAQAELILARQSGPLVEIARAAAELPPPPPPTARPEHERAGEALARRIRETVAHATPLTPERGQAIERALGPVCAGYGAAAARALEALNARLPLIPEALGRAAHGPPCDAGALSRCFGATWGDWGAISEMQYGASHDGDR